MNSPLLMPEPSAWSQEGRGAGRRARGSDDDSFAGTVGPCVCVVYSIFPIVGGERPCRRRTRNSPPTGGAPTAGVPGGGRGGGFTS